MFDDVYKNFKITDNSGIEKAIEINKDYLDIIYEERDVLKNLDREHQILWINRQAQAKGIQEDEVALGRTYAAILAQQEDQTKLALNGIKAVQDQVNVSVASVTENVLGKQAAAVDNYVQDYMNSTLTVSEIAKENVDKLVGMKAEEAEEFLKIEAMKQGLTEEEAKEAAKNLLAINQSTTDVSEALTQDEILKKIRLYSDEYNSFKDMEQAKLKYQGQISDLRIKLAQNEYAKNEEALRKGSVNGVSQQEWVKSHQKEMQDYNKIQKDIIDAEKKYKDLVSTQEQTIKDKYGMSASDATAKFNKKVDEYKTAAEDAKKAQSSASKGIATTIKQFLDKVKNGVAGDVDLNPWDYTVKKDTGDGYKDLDSKSAVDAAKDLKTDLESNRADLTPVFDLDQLQSDANKANGIVMSSLMAAQNASIADYINKDSELNPFMKDRWQNVYNFTQNNYSPKALSRIDIYRQTQRQLGMSRGF